MDSAEPRRKLNRQTIKVGGILEGMQSNSEIARKALKTLGLNGIKDGNASLLAVLAADPKPSRAVQTFLAEAVKKNRGNQTILKVAQDLGTSPAEIFLSYARGIQTLGQAIAIERVAEVIASRMETVVTSLLEEAVPHDQTCDNCNGSGKYGRHNHLTCPNCDGVGKVSVLGDNWKFAQQQVYEISGLKPEKGGIQIQQTTTNNVKGPSLVVGGGFMEKVASLSDELMSKQTHIVDVTPVQNVLPEADIPAAGGAGSQSLQAVGEDV